MLNKNNKGLYKKLKGYVKKKFPLLLRIYKLYLFSKRYSNYYFVTKLEKEISEKFNIYLNKISAEEKTEKIKKLKEGLDSKGKEEIDTIIFRHEILSKNNFINKKELISKQEIIEQKEWKKISLEKYKKHYKLNNYAPEVFYGISGLKWLPEKQKNKLKNGVFLDIGAYDGDSALSFYYNFSPKKIYAFEPENNNFNNLLENSKKLDNDIIVPIKKGTSNRIMQASISSEHTVSKLIEDESLEKIDLDTIDNFILENKIENVNLIKMDIEGEETNALLGAKKTIIEHKPILAISIYHNPKDFFEIKPWLEEIVPEYKFIVRKANPCSFVFELMLIAYVE
jgi:FkbM family methyltransferase